MAVDIKMSRNLLDGELTHSVLAVHAFCGLQGCILLNHIQYYKYFWKINNSKIYWGSFYCHHHTEKTCCKLEKKLHFFCQVARGRKLLMSFVYINNMRKCPDRLDYKNITWISFPPPPPSPYKSYYFQQTLEKAYSGTIRTFKI